MRMALLALAAGALTGGVAQANDDPGAMAAAQDAVDRQRAAPAAKVLYVCSEEERDWRLFSRDLGLPDFVTAEQVRAAGGKSWAAPKCITPAELRRLTGTKVGRLSVKPPGPAN